MHEMSYKNTGTIIDEMWNLLFRLNFSISI